MIGLVCVSVCLHMSLWAHTYRCACTCVCMEVHVCLFVGQYKRFMSQLINRFRLNFKVGFTLNLLDRFNYDLYWCKVMTTLQWTKNTFYNFTKNMCQLCTWYILQNMIYNFHLKYFLIWKIFNKINMSILQPVAFIWNIFWHGQCLREYKEKLFMTICSVISSV
jgi:hypothetical protein